MSEEATYRYFSVKMGNDRFAVRVNADGDVDAAPPIAGDVVGTSWETLEALWLGRGAKIERRDPRPEVG